MTTTNHSGPYTVPTAATVTLRAPPKIVGYVLPFEGTEYAVTGKKPGRFHLWMMRVCFGWKWEDAK